MRYQPRQPRSDRSAGRSADLHKRIDGRVGFAGAVLLASPFPGAGLAGTPMDAYPVFTVILAVLAGILGISASILYRNMHQHEEEVRRRAEDAEAELRALVMMTDEAVLVLSPDGTVRAANPASEELFDREAEGFVGESLMEVIAQPLALSELTRHGPVNFETTAKRGKNGFVRVEMLLSPVELTTGRGYLAIVHEVNATAAGDPLPSSKMADLHDSVCQFTHDLNNQLTSVLGNLSLVLMARPGDPTMHQRLIEAKKTAIRAQMLSHEMQALINPEPDGKPAHPETSDSPTMPDMNCSILPMPTMTPAANVPPERAPGPPRILILDDEETICMLVSSVLDASGFKVTSATSVAAALQSCKEATDSGTPFSLVICDLSLPGDVDGVHAVQDLRLIDPNIKAIVSSGYDTDSAMRDPRKFGFSAAMSKPYDIARLVRTVGETLSADETSLRKSA